MCSPGLKSSLRFEICANFSHPIKCTQLLRNDGCPCRIVAHHELDAVAVFLVVEPQIDALKGGVRVADDLADTLFRERVRRADDDNAYAALRGE